MKTDVLDNLFDWQTTITQLIVFG